MNVALGIKAGFSHCALFGRQETSCAVMRTKEKPAFLPLHVYMDNERGIEHIKA
jgi:hypothetical protein